MRRWRGRRRGSVTFSTHQTSGW